MNNKLIDEFNNDIKKITYQSLKEEFKKSFNILFQSIIDGTEIDKDEYDKFSYLSMIVYAKLKEEEDEEIQQKYKVMLLLIDAINQGLKKNDYEIITSFTRELERKHKPLKNQ